MTATTTDSGGLPVPNPGRPPQPTCIPGTREDEPVPTITADTTAAVLSAAADLADIFRNIPGGWRRLSPAAVRLVEAVNAHTEATR